MKSAYVVINEAGFVSEWAEDTGFGLPERYIKVQYEGDIFGNCDSIIVKNGIAQMDTKQNDKVIEDNQDLYDVIQAEIEAMES
ncbi:hypothetical protein HBP99_04295 [Listeria booriae]|uniref:hypothetical protein n=1 Tax=Listeria booriae TaxID=1552123 RepID=UPI001624709B|nr:hypothetical protein [Listeria booriae]MBC2367840.1 hypothetical protein [Listeria booriae]